MFKLKKQYKAFLIVGFPGTGKTTLAEHLASIYDNTVVIDYDRFYHNGQSDTNAYLKEIEKKIKKHNVVLSKNHHTVESRTEVIDILKKYNIHYYIINLLPNLKDLTREEENKFIDVLLDRIQTRKNDSQLVIDEKHPRERAKNIIIFGFLKKYVPPESFIQLDFLDSIENKTQIILNSL
jgi:adenylate kinase family enzyme